MGQLIQLTAFGSLSLPYYILILSSFIFPYIDIFFCRSKKSQSHPSIVPFREFWIRISERIVDRIIGVRLYIASFAVADCPTPSIKLSINRLFAAKVVALYFLSVIVINVKILDY